MFFLKYPLHNPYGNEVKNNNNEKYIEIGDDDESLPF